METKKINQQETSQNKSKGNLKKGTFAAVGATAVAGVAIGSAGMDIANNDNVEESATEQEPLTAQAEKTDPVQIEEESKTESEGNETIEDVEQIEDPQAIIEGENYTSQQEPTNHIEYVEPEIVGQSAQDITEDIIAGEEIDPDDIDENNIINIDQIGNTYTADGQSLPAAEIHDDEGNNLMMIDIDEDGVFDIVATPEGEVISAIEGDIDVSDAEHMMTREDGGWLAANDFDDSIDIGEDFEDDIIEV